MPTLDNMLTICYGCRQLIDDRYYLMAVDRSWHLSCLKCSECGMALEQERTCFARYGQIFCKDDYIKYIFVFIYIKTKSSSCFF
jgi:LIM homeobox protein 2/9